MRVNVKSSKNRHEIEKWIGIPYELMQFVQRNTYSLLIKGSAGTGKTTLSLTILRALKVKSNFFYIIHGLENLLADQRYLSQMRYQVRVITYQVSRMLVSMSLNHFLRESQTS